MKLNTINKAKANDYFIVYHNNIRGASSKLEYLNAITKNIVSKVLKDELTDEEVVIPSVVMLNAINLRKNKKLVLNNYVSYNKNRTNGSMGGVATCVPENDANQVTKVSEGSDQNEFVITRHSMFQRPINVINTYWDVE